MRLVIRSLLLTALAAVAALGVAAAAVAQDGGDGGRKKLPPVEFSDPPEGLALVAAVKPPLVVQPGLAPEFGLSLVNRSKTKTHPVVLPNDGSESGLREPYVFWTAVTVAEDGTERPIEPKALMRCGLYATNWHADVVRLRPGESADIRERMPSLELLFDFQDPGRVRLTAHYQYRAGLRDLHESLDGGPPKGTGPMGDVKPFELRSEPVEFTVERPLDVVAEIVRRPRAGETLGLDEIVRARVVNRTNAPVEMRRLDWGAWAEVEPGTTGARFGEMASQAGVDEKVRIAPGASEPVFGEGSKFPRTSSQVTFDKPGRATVVVRFVSAGSGPRIRSQKLELVVAPKR